MEEAIIGAIISLLGDAFKQNRYQSNVDNARRYQAMMRSTAYQATVADMRKAGLNPMLAFSQGPTAMGGVPSVDQGDNPLSQAMSSGMQFVRTKQELDNMKATVENVKADTVYKDAQTHQSNTQSALNDALAEQARQGRSTSNAQEAMLRAQIKRALNLADVEEGQFGRIMAYVDRILSSLGLGAPVPSTK